MSCCGHKRQALRARSRAAPATRATAEAAWPLPQQSQIAIESTSASPITVKGAATGIVYRFTAPGSVLGVDARDADRLLATAFFRRKS